MGPLRGPCPLPSYPKSVAEVVIDDVLYRCLEILGILTVGSHNDDLGSRRSRVRPLDVECDFDIPARQYTGLRIRCALGIHDTEVTGVERRQSRQFCEGVRIGEGRWIAVRFQQDDRLGLSIEALRIRGVQAVDLFDCFGV